VETNLPRPRKRPVDLPREGGRPLDTAGLEAALGFRLRMLEQVVMRSFARHMGELDVTPTLYSILMLVQDNPLCRQTDLSLALKMHQPNLVERVGILIERGLIARREDPTDRRANVLQLTFAGKRFMDRMAEAHDAHLGEMRQLLGGTRYDALMELIPPSAA
jgi:DNA-binding MarR family transcriptional regulator